MPGLLTAASTLMCPHGGMVTAIPSSSATAGGSPIVLATDTFTIAGCAFAPVVPHPCVLVQWQTTAQRTTGQTTPTLNESSVGFCMAADGAVQGTVLVQATQASAASL